jgi:chromate transport protein ChrA
MDAQTLAIALLCLRILAVILLAATLIKQVKQLRTTTTDYPGVRIAVFIATIILFVGQFTPILLDAVGAFGSFYEGRSATPDVLPVSYSLNNALKDVVISTLLAVQHYRPRRK